MDSMDPKKDVKAPKKLDQGKKINKTFFFRDKFYFCFNFLKVTLIDSQNIIKEVTKKGEN